MIIEVSSHGSVVKREHDSFVVVSNNSKQEFPAERVEAIIITGNALISTQAVRLCMEKNVQMVISSWTGRPIGRFWSSSPGRSTQLRRAQYKHADTPLGFQIVTDIVRIKLEGQKALLRDLKNNRKDPDSQVINGIGVIDEMREKLSKMQYSNEYKQTLLGIEGASAAAYFRAISSILPSQWSFKERTQHPAKDGFNATLNYIYGMGYSLVEKIVILTGFDPNAGFYHSDQYDKPTFAFDLMETVRPIMDRLVVKLFTKKMANQNWFDNQEGVEGVYLNKTARNEALTIFQNEGAKEIETQCWSLSRKIAEKLLSGVEMSR